MDPVLMGAAGIFAAGSALALGVVAGKPTWLICKAATLWAAERILLVALRLAEIRAFDRASAWWVDRDGRAARPARHAGRRWTDRGLWADAAAQLRAAARNRFAGLRALAAASRPLYGNQWVTA